MKEDSMSEPKTVFVRGLWGVPKPEEQNRFIRRRYAITPEISSWKSTLSMVPFRTYVFGAQNRDFLREVGIEPVVLSEEPTAWDNVLHCFRHKIEIIRRAFDEFDRVVWLDWDCFPQCPTPVDFWEKIGGQPFKACLKMHKRPPCIWRDGYEAQRYLPSGGFIYVDSREVADKFIECWEKTGRSTNDEVALGKLGDDFMGGWKGAKEYCLRFEPYCVSGNRGACCPPEIEAQKMVLFRHR